MKCLVLTTLFAVVGLSACAGQSPAQHHLPTLDGLSSRVVELPDAPGAGQPRDARVLIDEPALKLASIILRGGAVLPPHHAEVPVTIVALQGSGTVVAGTERLRLDASHAVALAPKVVHAVEPDAGTDLILLVHHLGRSGGPVHEAHAR